MCGRLNVIEDPLCGLVTEQLGLRFDARTNTDLRPTQQVEIVAAAPEGLQQLSTPKRLALADTSGTTMPARHTWRRVCRGR